MKIIHCSDIHLNFCSPESHIGLKARKSFIQSINDNISRGGKLILLTGDITEAPHLINELYWLAENIKRPFYFTLGNHDFWHSSFEIVNNWAETAQTLHLRLNYSYLPSLKPIPLEEIGWYLIGFNGWYDCRNYHFNVMSDFINGKEIINDFENIKDLKSIINRGVDNEYQLAILQNIADEELLKFKLKLDETINVYKAQKIIIGTHVPPIPFKESHPGFYSNKKLMEFLCLTSVEYPQIEFFVLCGHNHGGGVQKLNNLTIMCKSSRYYNPNSILLDLK